MDDYILMTILCLVGIALLYLGYHLRSKTKKMETYGRRVNAQIVKHVEKVSRDTEGLSATYYYPVIEFKGNDNGLIQQELKFGTTVKSRKKTMKIIYLLENGEYEILIDNAFLKHWLPNILLCLGLTLVIVGLVMSFPDFFSRV